MKMKQLLLFASFLVLVSCIEQVDTIPIPEHIEPIPDTTTFNPYIRVIVVVQMNEELEPVIEETSWEPVGEKLGIKMYMDSVIYFHGAIDFRKGLLVSDCSEDTIYNDAITDTSITYRSSMAFWECLRVNACDPHDELFYFEIDAR